MIITDMLVNCYYPSQEQLDNAKILIPIINEFENLFGVHFKCTSGIRSMDQHIAIYNKLRAEDAAAGRPLRPIPLHSSHLMGNACDFICETMPITDLHKRFLEEDAMALSESLGAYYEMFEYTASWTHIQRVPPASGKMFFQPF